MDEAFEDMVARRLDTIESKVDTLVSFVESAISGMNAARQAPGMQGMMARQMLPDMTSFRPLSPEDIEVS